MASDKKRRKRLEELRMRDAVDYFAAFGQMADLAVEEAEFLLSVIGDFDPATLEGALARAHEIEAASDRLVDAVVVSADGDFVTPIGRDNIVELAIALDEITDEIEKVVKHLFMYDVGSIEPAAAEMCALVREECLVVQEAMPLFREFKKPKKLRRFSARVDELEDEVDRLYLYAVRALFGGGHEPEHIIKWRAIYSTIEECSDSIERAVDIMMRVVVNNN